MTTETRYHAIYMYPGSFFPEESRPHRLFEPSVQEVLANSPDSNWFAARVETQQYQSWESDGATKWLPVEGSKPEHFHVFVGEVFSNEEAAAMKPGDPLANNLISFSWDGKGQGVLTRRGNWQALRSEHDIVLKSA